ncbi:MAG: type II secretion system protein E [Candidatus Nomurabacteria bacterium GW2011_GWF2_35_66]|uniref:Type II secretion system protein E n=1 Tax=Candidatus Nomurabacteria bacterium GW2011_GWE1_35_16 TaxID=1618761 RepID=A0A0G0BR17_9BACT|nr:MAG: type II secretion system protein E [Candidatus Nomurabacteria bacterium GW2011_GWF1_34_20]KKP62100.1 MAG: type II secretion system protein E [Candidatus Nomurabacteria bacterium GW2011_GWE2_34_25]KKP66066.1 MAG: type II secretion system protein E [Candidatus Nomurabacteria bacterium GW2011_GWE1_35_16]KKP83028.1 MAG: type II secretion system protein E [Candidatus Nomurabacteria bacterium GW2011_GWF2_35_66]
MYMHIDEGTIVNLLNTSGLVSKTDVAMAQKKAKETNQTLGSVLMSEGKLTEKDWNSMQAVSLGIPFVSLKGEHISPEVLNLIPEPIARNNNIIAYKKSTLGLEVAMLDVDNLPVIDFIKKKVGLRILPRMTSSDSIKEALSLYKKSLQADFEDIIKKESNSLNPIADSSFMGEKFNNSEKTEKELAEDLPIVKIVDTLISHAILQGSSDIHIEPGEESLVVRYRIDGILHDAMVLPKDTAPGIVARIKVLSNLKLDEKRLPQDGRFKIINDSGRVSFRVSTLPTYFGEKTVIRILRENAKGFSLEGLGFHGEALERIHRGMKKRNGMLLAAGPTGSGKTTTLYTMLDILNTPDVNISTVEDPIEYQMARINQTQTKSEIGLTFANGLRTLLRQDPDIIMVGEIRDGETASLAVNASLTGHLVLSTIHTNSAAGAIPRMIDMGVEPFLIVSTVKTVIAQRLVRKLSEEKEKYFLSEVELKALGKVVNLDIVLETLKKEKIVKEDAKWPDIPFYKPKPNKDSPDGYKGRVGIHEVLEVSSTIKELILKNSSTDDLEKTAKKEGMMTMLEDGIFLVASGVTSTEEVLRVVSE